MKNIRILIADRIEIYREGLLAVLGKAPNMEVVGQCETGEEAVEKTSKLHPDILLLDENIEHPDCVEVVRRINKLQLKLFVIIVTQPRYESRDPFYIFRTKASGYVDREITSVSILNCIEGVCKGDFFVSPDQGRLLVQEINKVKISDEEKVKLDLSSRESEIVSLVAMGLTNREIAGKLYITENTVKAHVTRIMQKMQVPNRQRLAAVAVERGIAVQITERPKDI
jgi:DNA-binding NarL/FixJ family response regulator